MDFTKERKVRHEEWDEATILASEFLANPSVFAEDPEDVDKGDFYMAGYPTLYFGEGSVGVDEAWGLRDGKLWWSSERGGVGGLGKDGQYYHLFYGSRRPLGQFLRLKIRLDEDLEARLRAA